MTEDLRKFLFHDWGGCSNHGCVVTGSKKGMGTNGACHCVVNASRAQLTMLQSRLQWVLSEQESGNEKSK